MPDRSEVLHEAHELEEAGAMWKAQHVAVILGIDRSSVFGIHYFYSRRIRIGRRSVRWDPKDVRLYLMLQRGAPPAESRYEPKRREQRRD